MWLMYFPIRISQNHNPSRTLYCFPMPNTVLLMMFLFINRKKKMFLAVDETLRLTENNEFVIYFSTRLHFQNTTFQAVFW